MQKPYSLGVTYMYALRTLLALSLFYACCASHADAKWLTYGPGSQSFFPAAWPAGAGLSGTATITASNFINGNNATLPIGLTTVNVGPALSPDFFSASLLPNIGNIVPVIGTPYNDSGDKYHVVIDFSGTTGSSSSGVLPAGTLFALVDLDILENYRNVKATNAANVQITTPWISGPNGYFDMTTPMLPQGSIIPNPTLVGPASGVYDMFGVSYNFDVGMWLFNTTQDVKTIEFDMERGLSGNVIGGGGAGWAFYSPIPEPTALALAALAMSAAVACRRRSATGAEGVMT